MEIDSCWFDYCYVYSAEQGGTFYLNNSYAEVSNTVIINDRDYGSIGPPITLNEDSHLTFDHSDIYYHYNTEQNAIEILDTQSTFTGSNMIFFAVDSNLSICQTPDNVDLTYSISQHDWPGTGNIIGDPLLTDSLRLTSASPCINAGDPHYHPDPDGSRTDMGAFYYSDVIYSGAVSGTWIAENNPYIIGYDAYVPASDTLTLMPGVIIELQDESNLNIFGSLQSLGEADSVYIDGTGGQLVFTSISNDSRLLKTDIEGMQIFVNGSQTVVLDQCDVNFYYSYSWLGSFTITTGHVDINNSNIIGSFAAENADSNSIRNSYIDGKIFYGDDWFIENCYIDHYVSFDYFEWAAEAYTIDHVSGIFKDNRIEAYACNTNYSDRARGIYHSDGIIINNRIISSSGTNDANGVSSCTGLVEGNLIEAERYGIHDFTGEIYNNTIVNCERGVNGTNALIRNCIITNCDIGINNVSEVQYSCVYNCQTFYQAVTVGPGCIETDPLFVDPSAYNYSLQAESPCIDAGDPDPYYNDPDGTRDDMGAYYFDQTTLPVPTVTISIEDDDVILSWYTVLLADGYNIYRSEEPYVFSETPISTVTDTTFGDEGAAAAGKYFYRVTVER